MLLKVSLLFFIFLSTLFSTDLNITTISSTPIATYKKLYKEISNDINKSNEQSLQETLLQKIIKLSDTEIVEQNISYKADPKSYLKIFDDYMDTVLKENSFNNEINLNANKINALQKEIKDNNSTTLTKKLFYAYYLKEQKFAQNSLVNLRNHLKDIKQKLLKGEKEIFFNKMLLQKKEDKLAVDLKKIGAKIEQAKLKEERYELLGESSKLKDEQKTILAFEKDRESLQKQKLELLFLKFVIALQNGTNDAFKIHKSILDFLKKEIQDGALLVHDMNLFLSDMEKSTLGAVATFKGKGVEEINTQVENLWQIANQPLFTINKTKVSIFKLAIALLIFILGFIVGNFYKRQIKKLSLKNRTITTSTRTLLSNLGYYLIFIITFFIVLKVLGIDLGSIALVAGALSVGIGFGLQNIISNFVSGIILMVERSVRIGDYVELDNNLRGYIHDIRMRSVTIVTNENINIIVPNQKLIENNVINWTMNDNIRRFSIPFGVAYGTDVHRVINLITEAVLKSEYREDIVENKKQQTSVIMTAMGDSSVNFELFVWVKGDNLHKPKRTASAFLVLIYDTLYENNIEIPFPQQDLHIRSVDTSLPITFTKTKDSL